MAYTINRHLANLLTNTGVLDTGKIPADYITNAHIADNTIASSQLHSSFTIGAGHIPANTVTISHLAVTDGTAGQVLKTDGSGNLSFTTISADKITEGNTFVEAIDTGSNGQILFVTENTQRWQISSAGHLLPIAHNSFDIGSASHKVRDLYVDDNSIHIGSNTKLSINADGDFQVTDENNVPKKLKVDEIEIGTGDDRVIIKKSASGDLEQQRKISGVKQTATKPFLIGVHNSGDITEGGSNKFYTDARVQAYLTGQGIVNQSAVIAAITDSAPATLDTLNELAAAIGDDANFSTTITNSIATKLPLAGGTLTGDLNIGTNDLIVSGHIRSGAGSSPSGFLFLDDDQDNAWPTATTDNVTVLGSVTHHIFAGDTNNNGVGGDFIFGRGQSANGSGTFTETFRIARDGAVTATGNTVITGTSGSGNAFVVQRGDTSAQVLRVHNSGEVVVPNNYLFAASPGTSFYSQGDAVFRAAIRNDTTGMPLLVSDDLNITGSTSINGTQILSSTRALTNVTGNISMFTNDAGYGVGDVTAVGAQSGTPISVADGGGPVPKVGWYTTLINTSTNNADGDYFLVHNGTANSGSAHKLLKANINISGFNNDAGYTSFDGDYNSLSNRPTIPTNNNQLTNGAGYITSSALSPYLTTSTASSTYATPSYVTTQIANLVDSAPGTLNTLNELAAALGDDPNFATTISNSIGTKAPISTTVTLADTQTISGAKTFTSASLRLKGHMFFDEHSAGRHYIHFKAASGQTTNRVDWRIQTNATNSTIHSWYHDKVVFSTPVQVTAASSSFKGPVYISEQNSTGEGGEITLNGSNGHTQHTLDTVNGTFRIFDTNGTFITGNSGYGLNAINGYRVNGTQVINSNRNTNFNNIIGAGINSQANYTEIGTSTASNLVFKRNNASYIQADTTGGYFIFITNGRGTSYANRALAITTDNDLQVGRNVVAVGSISGASISGASGNVTGKFAVKSSAVHNSYDFYNNGTSYFNGSVIVDDVLDITGTNRALKIAGTTRINSVGDFIGTSYYVGGTNVIDTSGNWVGPAVNAGTLDSLDSTKFTYYRGVVSGDWDTIFTTASNQTQTSGLYQINNVNSGHSNFPVASGAMLTPYSYGGVFAWNLSNHTFKLYSTHVGNLYYQSGWNNDEYSGWRMIIDSGNYAAAGLWASHNDGSGSGLDADTLDGIQGGSFLRSDAADTATGKITFNAGIDGQAIMLSGATNFDTLRQIGFYSLYNVSSGSTNPPPLNYGAMISTNSNASGGMGFQLAHERIGAGTFIRGMNDSGDTWYPWQEMWTAGTDGSGSGLDADTVDGYHASYLLNYNNLTNKPTISNINTGSSNVFTATQYFRKNNVTNYTDAQLLTESYGGASSTAGIGFHISGSIGRYLYMNNVGDLYWNSSGSKIWHAGNDGSGSGLDADTVDGQHASAFLTSFTETNSFLGDGGNASTHPGTSRLVYSGQVSSGSSVLGMPTVNNANAFINLNKHSGEYNSQLGFSSNGNIYYRAFMNTAINSTQAWRTIWDSGNDGSGSGLDADTVDGIGAASFLRGDINDSFDGNSLSFPTLGFSINNNNGAGSYSHYLRGNSTHIVFGTTNGNTFYQNYGNTSGSYNLSGVVTHNAGLVGNKLWGISNDGSGSGLDADLLDGQQGSYYAPASSIPTVGNGTLTINTSGSASGGGSFTANQSGNTTITISATDTTANQTITLSGPVTGSGTTGISTANPYQTSVNFATTGGPSSAMEYQQLSGVTDTKISPSGDWYNSIRMGHGHPYTYYSNTIAVKMTGSGSGNLFTQTIAGGSANGWKKHWSDSNDGSGSGLDADTVDGIHAASFLRSDTSDSITAGTVYTFGTSNTEGLRFTNSSYSKSLYIGGWSSANSSGISRIRNSNDNLHLDSGSAGGLYLNHYSTGTVYARGQTVWHAGNDGSGSGLDADTVDGQHASAFLTDGSIYLRSNASDIFGSSSSNQYIRFNCNSGQYIASAGSSSRFPIEIHAPTANGGDAGITFHISGDYAGFFGLASDINDLAWGGWSVGSTTKYRIAHTGNLGTTLAGYWKSSNDGSGSGLDADTVDGIHGSSLLRSDTADSIENNIVITQRGRFTTGTSGQNNNAGDIPYGFGYQISGAWSHPYPDLILGFHTGVRLGGHKNYGGCRFYEDHPSRNSTIAFSVANGDSHVRANANIYAYTSDKRLKENFRPIENAVDKVKSLDGLIFDWRKDMMDKHEFRPDQEKDDTGLIAQEVQKVLPAAIKRAPFDYDPHKPNQSKSGEEFLTVQYEKVVPLLVQAIKEQQEQIDELKKLLENK